MYNPVSAEQDETISRSVQMPDADSANVAKAQEGDMHAFENLVLKYEGKIYSIALHLLSNSEDAKDATQEVFIKVYRSLAGFRGDAKFSTWLYRITNNVCLDYLRKRSRREFSLDGETETDDGGKTSFEIPDSFDMETAVENTEFNALVQKSIKMLPEQHRVMIIMRDVQDLSYTEISGLLSLPEGTVKSRINRARKCLRDIFLNNRELKEYIYVK